MNISNKRNTEIRSIREEEIDTSDIPELDEQFWSKAVLKEPKQAISLRIDGDVLSWFRERGRGYQSRMNAVLRQYMNAIMGRG